MNSPKVTVIDREDRASALDDFARPSGDRTNIVPAAVFAAPAERVFGAQRVAVRRDEAEILRQLKVLAAAAGEDWYYRFPVNKKNEDGSYQRDWIEGPSIKCANNVSRLYGNCDIDVREFDVGTHWVYYARFIDLETGYSLTRPFRQRKSQKAMRTDAGRQEDIAYQIGASKAIRNVICNALEFFVTYAADEAKASIIDKVGKRLDFYKERIAIRLAELKIDAKRIENARGRPLKDWTATDVARTIAELQAIQDGMATADETYPTPEKPRQEEQTRASGLGEFAQQATAAQPQTIEEQPALAEQRAGEAKPSHNAKPSEPQEQSAVEPKPDPIGIASQRGWDARKTGMQRKAVPPEYRVPARKAEADAWLEGYDRRVEAEKDGATES